MHPSTEQEFKPCSCFLLTETRIGHVKIGAQQLIGFLWLRKPIKTGHAQKYKWPAEGPKPVFGHFRRLKVAFSSLNGKQRTTNGGHRRVSFLVNSSKMVVVLVVLLVSLENEQKTGYP